MAHIDALPEGGALFEGDAKGSGTGGTGGRMSQRSRMASMSGRTAARVSSLPRAQRTAYHSHRNAGLGHKAALAKATGQRIARRPKKAEPAKKAAPKRITRTVNKAAPAKKARPRKR